MAEIKFKDDIQKEISQLQNLKNQVEVIKTEILQFAFEQRDILQKESDAGKLEPFLEINAKNILKTCKSKLQELSAVAEEVIPIANTIKNKRPDLVGIVDEWLDLPFLNALASENYSEHVLQVMKNYDW